MKLSIGKAWDETKPVLAQDGRALSAIALAMLVLPGAIIETIAPSSLREQSEPSVALQLLGLLVLLITLAGQVAISRIGLGAGATVGQIIGHAFRRLPALFGALIIIAVPFMLLVAGIIAATAGLDADIRKLPPSTSILVLVVLIAFLFVLVRMLFLTPLAAERGGGSIALLRSSWGLTTGSALKLFGLIVLLLVIAIVLIGGLGGALAAVIILALGPIEPGNVTALLVALSQQLLSAAVSVLFALVVARLYVQAMSGVASVSVPDAGHQ